MRLFLLIITITISTHCYSQKGFKTFLGLDPDQHNSAYHVVEHEDNFYMSGQYIDTLIGQWNSYIAIFDKTGEYIKHHLIRNDTVFSANINNNVEYDSLTYNFLGFSDFKTKRLTYNFAMDSFYVSESIDQYSSETGPRCLLKNPNNNNTYVCGIKTNIDGNNDLATYRVFTIDGPDTLHYILQNPEKDLVAQNMRWNQNGELVVVGFISFGNRFKNRDSTFVMIFDEQLNVLESTLDTPHKAPALVDKGMCIDSNNDIVCTHQKRYLLDPNSTIPSNDDLISPGVMKFDNRGKHLWIMEIGDNINNTSLLGRWKSIIESQEKDGYIIVGSEVYQSPNNDTILADAVIAKVSLDGDSLWMRRYSYEREGYIARDEFNDVFPTSDGGYIISGKSTGFDSDPQPLLYSILMKLDKDGLLDTSGVSTVTIDKDDELFLYPNPTTGPLYLRQDGHENYHIKLVNNSGVAIKQYYMKAYDHTIVMDTESLMNDVYYLQIIDNKGKQIVKKLVIQK